MNLCCNKHKLKQLFLILKNLQKNLKILTHYLKQVKIKFLSYGRVLDIIEELEIFLATSKILVKKYNSKLPREIDEIKTLPGIGDYTSNVLAALIYNKPTLALDGNVKRVISRILNKEVNKIDFKYFKNINKKNLFNTNRNSDFVEAMMEFGALVCNSKIPKCEICPIPKKL